MYYFRKYTLFFMWRSKRNRTDRHSKGYIQLCGCFQANEFPLVDELIAWEWHTCLSPYGNSNYTAQLYAQYVRAPAPAPAFFFFFRSSSTRPLFSQQHATLLCARPPRTPHPQRCAAKRAACSRASSACPLVVTGMDSFGCDAHTPLSPVKKRSVLARSVVVESTH